MRLSADKFSGTKIPSPASNSSQLGHQAGMSTGASWVDRKHSAQQVGAGGGVRCCDRLWFDRFVLNCLNKPAPRREDPGYAGDNDRIARRATVFTPGVRGVLAEGSQ
jgi:hypothetical protein